MKVYINQKIVDKSELKEVLEPGFLFGWGVFEALRAYSAKPAFLGFHIERLNKSLELVGLEKADISWQKTIDKLLKENKLSDAYIRITAYRKREGLGLVIYVDKFSYYTDEVYKKGFKAIISTHKRDINSITSKVKSLSYLENRIAWFQAQKQKKQEALLLNQEGNLAGGARSNLFLVKDKTLLTPAVEEGAFSGITRQVILDIAKQLGLGISKGNINPEVIVSADEAFITSSLMEVMPLVEVGDKQVADGKPGGITLKLLEEYRKLIR